MWYSSFTNKTCSAFLRTFKFTGKPVRDLTVVITLMTPTDLLGPCVGEKKFFQSFYIINLTGRRSQCAGIIHTWAACFATGFGGESGRKENPPPQPRMCMHTDNNCYTEEMRENDLLDCVQYCCITWVLWERERERWRWREIKREREKI